MKIIGNTGLLVGALSAMLGAMPANATTLESVKQKGFVQCGVSQGSPGFSLPDAQNNWTGMDVDFCRAVAAAVFNDPKKVKFTPLSAKERFTALQSGEVDILSRTSTWTMSRDTSMGLLFAGVLYYDGQGFMVKKSLGIDSALKLDGAAVCAGTGTTTELNVSDYFNAKGLKFTSVAIDDSNQLRQAYEEGRCDVLTSDQSVLYSERLQLKAPDDHVVLPEIISKEPLGPATRQGDDQWFNIVKWTYFALLTAEEDGITSSNVDEMLKSTNPEIQRLLGVKNADGTAAGFGSGIGLDEDWVVHIVKGVGNYGEMFDRNLGDKSELKIARGKNALWKDGGLQYAPPIR
ncbi:MULTISPECIES: amino acid ABC transporter substrate-binding protein [Rhizobium]|uniref:Amino acid ABC transporter substrate-binding protein n=1 Tax=Rhizobium fabae TaxID=573179 RepID=A0A7W6FIM1_9HYPH|nr:MULTISPECIES: amino acid ABC transporter substrate-binding protein [Rhizobium]MBB3914541.1 general L-amino acid transport system substrate-binding protein [Rhizobium fabae]PDS66242.1 amino acid ABC transporter substrate-binding protein [Rhizobium anhuiense]RUM14783.1 amino acid ABC transporter substrate-binding protein [Rhizobium fabae]